MKVLVLDGSIGEDDRSREVSSILDAILTERKVHHEVVRLGERTVLPCTGCRECWVGSPGLCTLTDDGNALMRSWLSSDIVVMISRMTFGSYSSLAKAAIDRMAGLLVPYLVAEGECVEHVARYDRAPSLLGIVVCDELKLEESETFKMLIKENGRTLGSRHSKSLILWKGDTAENIRELVDSTVMSMKVVK